MPNSAPLVARRTHFRYNVRMLEIFVCVVDASRLDVGDERLQALVSPLRAARIAQLRHAADRRRSLGAELALDGALRAGLAHYAPPPRYRYADRGKPELLDGGAQISIAHAGDWAVCALSNRPVGVDIERADRASAIPVWQWVGIESYLKLTGEGLSGRFRALEAREREILLSGARVAFLARAKWADCLICAASAEPARLRLWQRQ
jgi:phosphopantetheinyl transferase